MDDSSALEHIEQLVKEERDLLDSGQGKGPDADRDQRLEEVKVALDPVEFDSGTRLAFYRVAQEALGNIAKHTQATEVEISLSSGENIELWIRDNGGGFDTNAVPAGHLGLIIMRERAEAVGAKLEINATPGIGTDVRLSVAGV